MKTLKIMKGIFLGILSCLLISNTHAANGEDVTQTTGTSRYGQGFTLGADVGYRWGDLDTNLKDNATGGEYVKRDGEAIDGDTSSLGLDLRYRFGMPLFQNNIRRPAFCGAWGRYNLDQSDRGLNLDRHALTAGTDTTLSLRRDGFLMPYCGAGLFSIQQFLEISFYLGGRFEFSEISGVTDETGGGGQRERFRKNTTAFGPTFGLEGEAPLPFGNKRSSLYFGVAADRYPDISKEGTSGSNFHYDFEVERGWNSRTYLGFRSPI